MAKKKNESIADQIFSLEKDLEKKSALLKSYNKVLDKLLKEIFGLSKSEIDALILESKTVNDKKQYERSSEEKNEFVKEESQIVKDCFLFESADCSNVDKREVSED